MTLIKSILLGSAAGIVAVASAAAADHPAGRPRRSNMLRQASRKALDDPYSV
jgi:hypothetical protein